MQWLSLLARGLLRITMVINCTNVMYQIVCMSERLKIFKIHVFAFCRLAKHISLRKWRRMKNEKVIDPTKLSKAERETCFCPRWMKGAIAAVHEAAEAYLVGIMEDANLLAIHARCYTIQPRDIQLCHCLRGDKDWDKIAWTK